ncbi:ras GEF [Durotheca rogersii]|uniref:ras GEF n=1 Tax=Durotheca rogersii TaxID=419775 RepID=UPI002220D39A|nr:ras GEF [Durotheca rogersii]KAI5864394.1 ras GEF [Durotheca rogersii]
MEVDFREPRSTLTRSNPSVPPTPRGDLSARSRTFPKAGVRDSKLKRSPQLGGFADKLARARARIPQFNSSTPLLPASERRSGPHDGIKPRWEVDGEKWNITPDGGSAGREGRHFTVANVGNNGQIFLRPSIRPANQRFPQPSFVFPSTTPLSPAGANSSAQTKKKPYATSDLLTPSILTPTPEGGSPTPALLKKKTYFDFKTPKTRSRRAMSDSTIHDPSIAQEGEAGVFKVVISKPQDEPRSKTAEDAGLSHDSLLQISIPSWKLGTPRFTLRGTPLIRGSSYAPTEEFRSSSTSFFRPPPGDINSLQTDSLDPGKPRTNSTPHVNLHSPALLSPSTIITPRSSVPRLRSTYLSTHLVIVPSMFDALTFKPACDDRSIVRYSSATGAVTAATPPRLVAEITSPSFLDYELISDFFLTFRAFLEAQDLLKMLVARLRWAVSREDETGMVVRVRTFVAMRHWILNYFVDDFVVDYHLRVMFCNLINDFVEELSHDERGRKVQLKILAELKKCWRRVCAQYWDGPEFDSSLGPDIPIAPGGIAGHRDPSLDPSFWETESDEPPNLYDIRLPDSPLEQGFLTDVAEPGHIDSVLLDGVRSGTLEDEPHPAAPERRQASPISIASLDVVSCSFPTKGFRVGDPSASAALAAHPADLSAVHTNTDPVAPTPRALTGKRVRPPTSHKRNNSLTDSLRDHGSVTEKLLYKNAEFLLTLPYAGSLVRGNLLPPGQAFVEIDPPSPWGATRHTTVFQTHPVEAQKEKGPGSAMSGQGMKKLIGSVRRALSTKGQGVSPTHGNFIDIAPIGPRGATTNRLPGTAIVPQARPPRANGSRAPIRIDVLGATIAEDFKKAVREDAIPELPTDFIPDGDTKEAIEYSPAHLDSSFELMMKSEDAVTIGSKSIFVVDGNFPSDYPVMTGALTGLNPSVEAFAESMMRTGDADLTPPTTPPGLIVRGNTPRRSSYLLGQHAFGSLAFANPPPPLPPPPVPDVETIVGERPSEEANANPRPSAEAVKQSPRRPPVSYIRQHQRQKSSRSYRSRGSTVHRRWASFQSGIAMRRSTAKSFDATTYSEGSVAGEIMPPPLRVLRRRPGGDLRGARNVHDLDGAPIHRSRSVGSLTTYSESIRSSYIRSPIRDSSAFVDVVTSEYSQKRADVFSLGNLAEQPPKGAMSLFSTHSSKPIMRPSFEAEAQKLAQIPDDIDDDGGVEAALLKLEGKFEKKFAKLSMEPSGIPAGDLEALGGRSITTPEIEHWKEEKRKHRENHVGEEEVSLVSQIGGNPETRSNGQLTLPRASEALSFLTAGSRETYNSIPLLDRGLMDDVCSKKGTREWTDHSVSIRPETLPDETKDGSLTPSMYPYEFVQAAESVEKMNLGETELEDGSRLDVDADSDNDSALSSEMSGDAPEEEEEGDDDGYLFGQPRLPKRPSPIITSSSPDGGKPPSPPVTLAHVSQASIEPGNVPQLHEHQLWAQKPLPPTPDTTPTTAMHHHGSGSAGDPAGAEETLRGVPDFPQREQAASAHLPFILAFDSEILAQQFTLIEKDALNEVDWKELIDMRWKDSSNDSRSWVDFLRNTDAHGVEVVIARFNIMVKWVISEVVLTRNMEERVRCLMKFLHIAAHCRKYRNFATMSQIAIALTSNEVARLSTTWAMVPPGDLKTMRDLEMLVSPTRNFYNLRAEMEGGGKAAQIGCIPFVGIYTHDLLFNSQRPSEIASSPTTAPLVNFERCRIAAAVVKTLLRLLEASTHYQFQPIEGITERCLWMSALSDEEIRKHSESLE